MPAAIDRRKVVLWGGVSLALHATLLAQFEAGAPPATGTVAMRIALVPPAVNQAETAVPGSTGGAAARPALPLPPPEPPRADSRSFQASEPAPEPRPARRAPPAPRTTTEPEPRAPAVRAPSPTRSRTDAAAAPASAPVPAEARATPAPVAAEQAGGAAGHVHLRRLLHAAIDRHKRYPLAALRQGREGRARVDFRLLPDGRVEGLELATGSGTRTLDRAALAAVRAIEPFTVAGRFLDRAERFEVDVVFRRE